MKGYPMIPGVPAAGHVTRGGFWHPGSESNCSKAPCAPEPPRDRRRPSRRTR